MKIRSKFKSGAASFYVVAFSTLILVIIASSFASAIVLEIARSSNNDLSQSAYDAAMAGVEDAKVAFINYQNCLTAKNATPTEPNNDEQVSCGEILWLMGDRNGTDSEEKEVDCNMVGRILGRLGKAEEGEVEIAESTTGNNMQQAYTCAIVRTELSDYRADLNSASPYKIIRIKLDEDLAAKDIESVKISWYSYRNDGAKFSYTNVISNESRVGFQSLSLTDPATPPTVAVQLIQTAKNFSLSDLNGKTNNGKTDRATVYLVPTNNAVIAGANRGAIQNDWTYIGAYDGGRNELSKEQLASTNDHSKDYPFVVYCPESSSNEYACSTTLKLPEPIGGERSDDTFMFVVSLPYGQPDTDFSLELFCSGDKECGDVDNDGNLIGDNVATLDKMQVMIDSTGRANDIYRRVEVRFEPANNAFIFPFYAVQVDDDFSKMLQVTSEWSESTYDNALNNL